MSIQNRGFFAGMLFLYISLHIYHFSFAVIRTKLLTNGAAACKINNRIKKGAVCMLKKLMCAAVMIAVCAAVALSLGGCGRDLGNLTEPTTTTAPAGQETVIITIDAYEFSALMSQLGGQGQIETAPAAQPTAPVPATVAP